MTPVITTLAERPCLQDSLWEMADTWPAFVPHDPVGWAHYTRIMTSFPEYVLIATDGTGQVVARALSVPFALAPDGRGALPDRGWDQVLLWAFSDLRHDRTPDTVSAIEVTVAAGYLGRGLSGVLLAALRDNARARGFGTLVAPVRPTAKSGEPHTPMSEYAFRTRADGLPHDPWLRTHVRAGGVVESVAPASMTIGGSLAEWRAWTGEPFDTTGATVVPGALVPVHCSVEHDHAVYVEPNVWVRHDLE